MICPRIASRFPTSAVACGPRLWTVSYGDISVSLGPLVDRRAPPPRWEDRAQMSKSATTEYSANESLYRTALTQEFFACMLMWTAEPRIARLELEGLSARGKWASDSSP